MVYNNRKVAENLRRKVQELQERLEAIKKHLTKYSESHEDWQRGRIGKWKAELEEILEDKE
ncbi:hypothetical protein ES707_10076 [subsurface metagenome]